jgi:hypothetical protein
MLKKGREKLLKEQKRRLKMKKMSRMMMKKIPRKNQSMVVMMRLKQNPKRRCQKALLKYQRKWQLERQFKPLNKDKINKKVLKLNRIWPNQ